MMALTGIENEFFFFFSSVYYRVSTFYCTSIFPSDKRYSKIIEGVECRSFFQ